MNIMSENTNVFFIVIGLRRFIGMEPFLSIGGKMVHAINEHF